MTTPDDLSITVGTRTISGWTDIRVTRGIERCPSDFEIGVTDLYPGEASAIVLQPGDACQVKIGNDLVITGYIDHVIPSIEPNAHGIRVTGRGKCQDLVDCAAIWPGGQISGASALGIAQKLAKPYGITVAAAADVGPPIPQFNMFIGESVFEIIERVTRFAALLAYEQPDGSLVLARAGKVSAASGFTQGQNIQRAALDWSMDQRYSIYECFALSTMTLGDLGGAANLYATAPDPGVPRYRNRYIVCEQGGAGQALAQPRVNWEAARRAGRGQKLTLTTDSWRDSAGTLWTPNTLAPISIPALKLPNVTWLIGEVTYHRSADTGTTAELVLMTPSAFLPEPVLLQPAIPDLAAGAPAPGGGAALPPQVLTPPSLFQQ